eukprot:m.55058 g.55058  ORF g.55058 m.55058 type:complete len:51 (-) comp22015_c0_seq1:101-253(-)
MGTVGGGVGGGEYRLDATAEIAMAQRPNTIADMEQDMAGTIIVVNFVKYP